MITWEDFEKIDMRVGTITDAEDFPEARKPAYKLTIDFGPEIGIRKSSAQITDHYKPTDLPGTQIIAVVNFPPKRIGPFISECLVLGIYSEANKVILLRPDKETKTGGKIG